MFLVGFLDELAHYNIFRIIVNQMHALFFDSGGRGLKQRPKQDQKNLMRLVHCLFGFGFGVRYREK